MNLGLLATALAMGIAAIGSAIGIGIAGQAAIGAWKKCYMNNKAAPFILTVFAGAPLTQTIYGFLLMQQMKASSADPSFLLGLGIASSVAMAISAYAQGKAGAAGADAMAETGKGFSQYITVVGLCETVALFALVFSMVALG
jgi:V/A-type H+-transporting ATPase subunit K